MCVGRLAHLRLFVVWITRALTRSEIYISNVIVTLSDKLLLTPSTEEDLKLIPDEAINAHYES